MCRFALCANMHKILQTCIGGISMSHYDKRYLIFISLIKEAAFYWRDVLSLRVVSLPTKKAILNHTAITLGIRCADSD